MKNEMLQENVRECNVTDESKGHSKSEDSQFKRTKPSQVRGKIEGFPPDHWIHSVPLAARKPVQTAQVQERSLPEAQAIRYYVSRCPECEAAIPTCVPTIDFIKRFIPTEVSQCLREGDRNLARQAGYDKAFDFSPFLSALSPVGALLPEVTTKDAFVHGLLQYLQGKHGNALNYFQEALRRKMPVSCDRDVKRRFQDKRACCHWYSGLCNAALERTEAASDDLKKCLTLLPRVGTLPLMIHYNQYLMASSEREKQFRMEQVVRVRQTVYRGVPPRSCFLCGQ